MATIEERVSALEGQQKAMLEEWTSRLYTVRSELIGRIDALEEKLTARMDALEAKVDDILAILRSRG